MLCFRVPIFICFHSVCLFVKSPSPTVPKSAYLIEPAVIVENLANETKTDGEVEYE